MSKNVRRRRHFRVNVYWPGLGVVKNLGRDLMTRKNVGPEATPVENHCPRYSIIF